MIANDDNKARCCAMGKDGNCTECPSHCHWTQHHNTPYIIKLVSKKKEKKIFRKAKNLQGGQSKILDTRTTPSRDDK